MTAAHITGIRAALLKWFDDGRRSGRRPMPWRNAPSLYNTVVSEFMLQQTQVETVRPYFERWVARWSDFSALAGASEDEVVRAWEGLGYYNRARNLRRLAIAVAAMPAPPHSAAAWRKLPGVGGYTAAAIASIAQGEPVAVVDGNVVRVLARLTAEPAVFKDNGDAAKFFAPLAGRVLSPAHPGEHNQAMMDLGALICRPQKPLCSECPVSRFCAASKTSPADFPRLRPRETQKVTVNRLWLVRDDKLLLQRHAAGARRLAALYELPLAERVFGAAGEREDLVLLARRRRAISNQQITENIFTPAPALPATPLPAVLDDGLASGEFLWASRATLQTLTLSGPHRRWINEFFR
ncbi:MAG: A/G-specific adenine glycosylase [Puniceicoccales bacterium]|jgi:A/G-specific adenine glycosylase|nr:A/G-specific adenine glycosylase [Puniceicoccales bacterium]